MKVREVGKYYELPIIGLQINGVQFDGLPRLIFNDAEKSYLDIHGPFVLTRYGQESQLKPRSKEAWSVWYDLFRTEIKSALADRKGSLFLVFTNGWELRVEDGPYENWHYTKQNVHNVRETLTMHGGVGHTTIF
ncbi:DUF6188 family protein [Hymenobacter sp. J193]|uniref:DUF6188 family protein n=1 Tax=Hymenobacter sp. J193 TaxID=2898429 RepID=UPI00215104DC|nr:DUF6188 family protein [Hymenobacter sp. J193]MCR5887836.1 DUF6188 family protein [Hymenobacter sp. J193]